MFWGGYFTLVYGNNGSFREVSTRLHSKRERGTHESKPTPKPLTTLPTIIDQNPTVNVCIAPPMVNATAPLSNVPFLPKLSPTRPAASKVTRYPQVTASTNEKEEKLLRTESPNLENRNHGSHFQCSWILEIFAEMQTSDNSAHDTELF